jgi:glucose/arabinose dehydrogenase
MRFGCLAACVLAGVATASGLARAQQTLATVPVVSGLSLPLYVTAPPGDFNRIFVLEQRSGSLGRVRIVNLPSFTLNATPYLTVTVSTGSEQGLLGLAFHPDFLNNGYFFVNYTRPAESGISAGSTIVARYRANPPYATSTTADPLSATILLTIPQPDANHNGGWIDFGPDGYLYIATGDGGCGNDSNCTNPPTINPPGHVAGGNAQSITANLLGKILRIDVDGADNIPGNDDDDGVMGSSSAPQYTIPPTNPYAGPTTGLDEIIAHGLRNPWRNAFDRLTGDLWIADVGQGQREEINFVPAGTLAGRNFGWRCMEGTRCTGLSGCTCNASNLTLPILEYPHSGTIPPTTLAGCSITGGYVYRGSAIPCFRGHYIFADYCTPQIWSFRRTATGELVDVTNRTAELDPPGTQAISNVTSFGEDARGELYIVDQAGGEVFKIVLGSSSGPDCNANGTPDSCDIAQGTSQDTNGNGVPDECECNPDVNCDGSADGFDVEVMEQAVGGDLQNFCLADPDFNGDGSVDGFDVEVVEQVVGGSPCP